MKRINIKVFNLNTGQQLADDLAVADNFFTRLKGLMFSDELASGSGLQIKPCRSIHTYFMNYPIDVLYVNEQDIIVALVEKMSPGRMGKLYTDASYVVELPAGIIQETKTVVGNRIAIQNEGAGYND